VHPLEEFCEDLSRFHGIFFLRIRDEFQNTCKDLHWDWRNVYFMFKSIAWWGMWSLQMKKYVWHKSYNSTGIRHSQSSIKTNNVQEWKLGGALDRQRRSGVMMLKVHHKRVQRVFKYSRSPRFLPLVILSKFSKSSAFARRTQAESRMGIQRKADPSGRLRKSCMTSAKISVCWWEHAYIIPDREEVRGVFFISPLWKQY
jgi:hypothetical protein